MDRRVGIIIDDADFPLSREHHPIFGDGELLIVGAGKQEDDVGVRGRAIIRQSVDGVLNGRELRPATRPYHGRIRDGLDAYEIREHHPRRERRVYKPQLADGRVTRDGACARCSGFNLEDVCLEGGLRHGLLRQDGEDMMPEIRAGMRQPDQARTKGCRLFAAGVILG